MPVRANGCARPCLPALASNTRQGLLLWVWGAWPPLLLALPQSPQPLPCDLQAPSESLRSPESPPVQEAPVYTVLAPELLASVTHWLN